MRSVNGQRCRIPVHGKNRTEAVYRSCAEPQRLGGRDRKVQYLAVLLDQKPETDKCIRSVRDMRRIAEVFERHDLVGGKENVRIGIGEAIELQLDGAKVEHQDAVLALDMKKRKLVGLRLP